MENSNKPINQDTFRKLGFFNNNDGRKNSYAKNIGNNNTLVVIFTMNMVVSVFIAFKYNVNKPTFSKKIYLTTIHRENQLHNLVKGLIN